MHCQHTCAALRKAAVPVLLPHHRPPTCLRVVCCFAYARACGNGPSQPLAKHFRSHSRTRRFNSARTSAFASPRHTRPLCLREGHGLPASGSRHPLPSPGRPPTFSTRGSTAPVRFRPQPPHCRSSRIARNLLAHHRPARRRRACPCSCSSSSCCRTRVRPDLAASLPRTPKPRAFLARAMSCLHRPSSARTLPRHGRSSTCACAACLHCQPFARPRSCAATISACPRCCSTRAPAPRCALQLSSTRAPAPPEPCHSSSYARPTPARLRRAASAHA
jgi:hypothetical protein